MTQLADKIVYMWRQGGSDRREIARILDCSETYVRKVVQRQGDVERRPMIKPDYKPVTRAMVVEGYFAWPTLGPTEIAKAYDADPREVSAICTALRLPFRGRIFPEDRAPQHLDGDGKSP